MTEADLLKQARFLFTSNRLIRIHLRKMHADRIKKNYGKIKKPDLTMNQHMAIMTINEHGPLTITALSEILSISAPSASAMVDKLVSRGILLREPSLRDRRKVKVSISGAAAKKIEVSTTLALEVYMDLLQKVGPEITEKWCSVIEDICNAVEVK